MIDRVSILRFIKLNGAQSLDEIVSSQPVGSIDENIRDTVRDMVHEGYIQMVDDDIDHDWVYRLKEKGRKSVGLVL